MMMDKPQLGSFKLETSKLVAEQQEVKCDFKAVYLLFAKDTKGKGQH